MQYFGQFNIPIHRCVKHVIFRQTIRKLPPFYVSLLVHNFSDQLTIYRNSNPKDKEISQGQQLLRQNNIAGQNKLMVTGTKTEEEKSRIRETKNLSTDADSRTDTIL